MNPLVEQCDALTRGLAQWSTVANPSHPLRVLIVDDEENIRYLVSAALELDGMVTEAVASGLEAIETYGSFRPDLIVLDVMMPGLDGYEVLNRMRREGSTTPVIFLTARDSTDDRVRGLTGGAVDYVVKPFAVAELVARVRLRARSTADPGVSDELLRCADLELDLAAHRVTRAGEPVELSPTEFRLLHYLMANTGQALTRSQLLEHVWEIDFNGDGSVLDTYISYLRRKVDKTEPKLIHTIRGVGYTLRVTK